MVLDRIQAIQQWQLGFSQWIQAIQQWQLGFSQWIQAIQQWQLGSSQWIQAIQQWQLGSSQWRSQVNSFSLSICLGKDDHLGKDISASVTTTKHLILCFLMLCILVRQT
jgi:hypothetical protein